MFEILYTLPVAVTAAVYLAHRVADPKTAKVVLTPIDQVSLIKEQTLLAKTLLQELDRMKNSKNPNPDDLDLVVKSFETIIRAAWPLRTYYGKRNVAPFLRVLHTSVALERDTISEKYLTLLSVTIREIAGSAIDALTRGDDGDEVTSFAFDVMSGVENKTKMLEAHNAQRRVSL